MITRCPKCIQLEKIQTTTGFSPWKLTARPRAVVFEGQFPVKVIGKNGEVIARLRQSLGDWKRNLVLQSFLEFPAPAAVSATLVWRKMIRPGQGECGRKISRDARNRPG